MQQSVPEFEELLKTLNNEGVRYVIIGGLAMILHGATYVTYDFDFAPDLQPSNISAIVRALAPLDPKPYVYNREIPFVWDERSFFGPAVELTTLVGEVDILRVLPGLDSFEGLWERAETREMFGLTVRVASLEDLVAMKTEANRPKDAEHIAQLKTLIAIRDGQEH